MPECQVVAGHGRKAGWPAFRQSAGNPIIRSQPGGAARTPDQAPTLLRKTQQVGCPATLHYSNTQAGCDLALGSGWTLRLSYQLFAGLEAFGQAEVKCAVTLKSGGGYRGGGGGGKE